MSKVKDENFVSIQGWMLTKLGLKGNCLLVYAIIYGFSQDGKSAFSGSLQYLADWTNSTRRGALKNINSLIEKGVIVKKQMGYNNVGYYAIDPRVTEFTGEQSSLDGERSSPVVVNKVHHGGEQSSPLVVNKVHHDGEQSSPNNIDKTTNENIVKKYIPTPPEVGRLDVAQENETHEYIEPKKKAKSTKPKPKSKESGIDAQLEGLSDNLASAMREYIAFRKAMRKPLTPHAISLALKKLDSLCGGNEKNKISVIEQSILNGWMGLFELNRGERRSSYGNGRRGPIGPIVESEQDFSEPLPF